LGLGDTFATVFGKVFGLLFFSSSKTKKDQIENSVKRKNQMFRQLLTWPQSKKTIVGTFGFCFSMMLTLYLMGTVYQAYTSYYLSRSSQLDWNVLGFDPVIHYSSFSNFLSNFVHFFVGKTSNLFNFSHKHHEHDNFSSVLFSIIIVSIVEATTTQIDNIVLPIICVITLSLFTTCLVPL